MQNKSNQMLVDYIIKRDFKGKQTIKKINVEFNNDCEIIKILETQVKYMMQIIIKDHAKSILFIVSWDFIKNIEYS